MRRLGLRASVALAVWLAFVIAITTAGVLAVHAQRMAIETTHRDRVGLAQSELMNLAFSLDFDARRMNSTVGTWGNHAVFVIRDGRWQVIGENSLSWPAPFSPDLCLPPTTGLTAARAPGTASTEPFARPCGSDSGPWTAAGTTVASAAHEPFAVVKRVEAANFSSADTVRHQLIWTGVLGSLLAALGAWWVSGWLTRPVRRASLFASRFALGEREVRLPVEGRDELADMSREFNEMSERVARTLEAQERFVADTAHELRTPTAALLASASALENPRTRDRAAALIAPQLRRLSGLTEDLLALSRFDADRERLTPQLVDLADLAGEVLRDLGAPGEVRLHEGGPGLAECDPVRVRSILRNLVGNALRHGAPPVTIVIAGMADQVIITVADGGAGVATDLRERVFDRFVRGDQARQGQSTGLGLAIARENARLHGGELGLDPDGRTFRLTLPHRVVQTAEVQRSRTTGWRARTERWVRAVFFIGLALGAHALWVLTRPYLGEPDFVERLRGRWAAGSWLFVGWRSLVQLAWLTGAVAAWALLDIVTRRAGRLVRLCFGLALVALAWWLPAPGDARIWRFLAVPLAVLLAVDEPSQDADEAAARL